MADNKSKPVIQKETTGCAIASAAVVAGISYDEAKRVAASLGIHATDSTLWSETNHIRRLLNRLGIQVGDQETPFSTWNRLPDCALLAIKWHVSGGKPHWHWVVFLRDGPVEQVLDSKKSLKTNIRKDFGRIKPKWFIEVQTH
jgi:hypothetical protein